MMFGDPEFFDIETNKMMGLWPIEHLPAYGMIPYIKRLGKEVLGVELGVLKGETSAVLLEECPNIRTLYAIDPYKPYFDGNKDVSAEEMDQYNKIAVKNLSKFKNVAMMTYSSFEVSDYFEDGSLDFVFIDTVQEKDHLLKELELWYPKIKTNGMIFGHDSMHEQVVLALKEFRKNNKITYPISHSKNQIWFWTKK